MKKAVIVDVDGTLSERGDRGPFEWHKVGIDTPQQDIINLSNMFKEKGYIVIVLTGRDGICYDQTALWLEEYGVKYDKLYSRLEGDYRKDSVIKQEIYEKYIKGKYSVEYVVDDRNQVVNMWRSLGLRCLQVAEGNF